MRAAAQRARVSITLRDNHLHLLRLVGRRIIGLSRLLLRRIVRLGTQQLMVS